MAHPSRGWTTLFKAGRSRRVDQKRVVEGWSALQRVERYEGGAGKGIRRVGLLRVGLRSVGLRGVGNLFLSLNIFIIKKIR